jgi:hypothetical protein
MRFNRLRPSIAGTGMAFGRALSLPLLGLLAFAVSPCARADEEGPLPPPASSREPITVDYGASYSKGNFGDRIPSETHTKTLSAQWTMYDVDFQLGTSYLERTAPAGTIIRRVKHRLITVADRVVSSSGGGDINLNASSEIYYNARTAIAVNALGGIKFGTADSSKGLGTGKNDYSAGLAASYPFEKTMLSVGALYSVMGSPGLIIVNGVQERIRLNNAWSYYVSLSGEPLPHVSAAVSYGTEDQSSGPTSTYAQAASLSLIYNYNAHGGVRAFVSKGTTQYSPDWTSGLSLFLQF